MKTFFRALFFTLIFAVSANATVTNVYVSAGANIQTAISSCSSPSASNVYNVILAAGTYDITSYATQAAPGSGAYGLLLPAYVNLMGATTDYTQYIVKYAGADGSTNNGQYETIHLVASSNVSNLTILNMNGRYGIHIDSTAGTNITINNCWIENQGNWQVGHTAYATYAQCGWFSADALGFNLTGAPTVVVSNTTMIGRFNGVAAGGHAWNGASAPANISFINCTFSQPDGGAAIDLSNIGSGQPDQMIITNCSLSGQIIYDDLPWLGTAGSVNHNEFSITMDEASIVPWIQYDITSGNNQAQYTQFTKSGATKTISTSDNSWWQNLATQEVTNFYPTTTMLNTAIFFNTPSSSKAPLTRTGGVPLARTAGVATTR